MIDRRLRSPDPAFWEGRSVLVTGHTGFKGSWLVRWLSLLGAEVHGLALDPPTRPSLFEAAGVAALLASDHRVDIRDAGLVRRRIGGVRTDVVLHLAAQPLVRDGYRDPSGTFATNVTGTANLLGALGSLDEDVSPSGVVVVTTDKVYLPDAVGRPHREDDPLGGHDPYSASKAMAEGVVATFRGLPDIDGRRPWRIPLATARAGNVIGGGDWSHERLLPDCVRAFAGGEPVVLRLPSAVRPWQHVLEPLAGYLLLAEDLVVGRPGVPLAVNLGPDGDATVGEVAGLAAAAWGDGAAVRADERPGTPPETATLRLDNGLARDRLAWWPRWGVEEAVARTVAWHLHLRAGDDMAAVTDGQIRAYADA